ncbi:MULTISPECIES: HAD family hydrolase [Saccharothrix]|uniref:HAD family hydrolase n=1 Tax=Saccharothrix TaxID=2071 RepID=UPI00093AB987|nr:HAD family hydrolase [Saccharothrix sp. CB00851]OKI32489.1 hypothetical protein A6A25_25545 [Saccharothrix sp. CB00851]
MTGNAGTRTEGRQDFAVAFDFFGTLVEIDRDVPTFAEVLTRNGFPCPEWLASIFTPEAYNGVRTHREPPTADQYERWRRRLLADLARCCAVPADAVGDLVHEMIELDRKWTVKAKSQAGDLLSWLHANNVRTAICSNWDYDLAPYLRQAGLPTPDVTVTSAEVGARKPHPALFAALSQRLSSPPERIVFVGDDLRCDIAGAANSGMRAVWLTATAEPVSPDSRINACADLAEVWEVVSSHLGLAADR